MFVYLHLGLGLCLCLCLYSQPIPDTAAKTATRRVQYRTDYVQYKTEYVGAAPVARPLQTQQIQQYVEVWLFERGGARGVGCVGGRDSF